MAMAASEKRTANALGGKTARACDSCLCKRARWFCPADDAFLCQACDTSVHSANQLASRHERVRLGTSSSSASASTITTTAKATTTVRVVETKGDEINCPPTWHHGFTRKARTPRHGKKSSLHEPGDKKSIEEKIMMLNPLLLVPEITSEENSCEENDEQLLYRVPVFDPFDAELNQIQSDDHHHDLSSVLFNDDETCDLDLPEFLPSDVELAEFAADVETLLGENLDDQDSSGNVGVENLGVSDDGSDHVNSMEEKVPKEEDEEDEEVQAVIACNFDPDLDGAGLMIKGSLDWNFDYDSSSLGITHHGGEDEEKKVNFTPANLDEGLTNKEEDQRRRRMLLSLNYEGVISAWATQGSPWTSGIRPDFNLNDCIPDLMGLYNGGGHHPYGRMGGSDGGREARVSRYREKRRTRLFAKKIRYEVRKLNAEKRPRLKGRFVKRTSFVGGSSSFPYLMHK